MKLGVVINRDVAVGSHPFKDIFGGFEKVAAVKAIFGRSTDKILTGLEVEIEAGRGYMRINDKKGSVMVNAKYLKDGDETYIYLDIVHELVHIRQHMEGKELWDKKYAYVDRPTELEAYKAALKEARRLGLKEAKIIDYLKVDWVSDEDFRRFLGTLGVKG
ncbi:MAG: hypothetical protein OK438_08245 [Thaumarchaeota archaeon]|nr:hypothetical protein [Nitrososphaerota archaeon]